MGEAIVVGTDGSDTAKLAFDEATRLAKALDAELHIVSAFKPLTGAHISGAPTAAAKVWQPLPDSAVESILAQAASEARFRDVKYKTHTSQGDPADALIAVAREVDAEMIIVGNKGMHGARRVLGSVPDKVAHHAPCSVLIVSTA